MFTNSPSVFRYNSKWEDPILCIEKRQGKVTYFQIIYSTAQFIYRMKSDSRSDISFLSQQDKFQLPCVKAAYKYFTYLFGAQFFISFS